MKKPIKRKINNQSGAAMLISVVFFLFITVAIISGLVGPTVSEFKNANMNLNSKKSYFLAESGGEDAFYRIKNNLAIGNSESLTLDANSATTTIVDDGFGHKTVTSLGDVNSLQRKVNMKLSVGAGTSFNYGVQVGEGGLVLQNSSSVLGNVYSNGSVVGTASISSNANNPSFISSINVGPTAYKLVQGGSYLYVVNENTLQTVNISNPASPSISSTITGSGAQQKDIAIANGYLFVTATNDNLVRSFSLSNPATPSYVGQVSIGGGPQAIEASGSYAYVLSYAGATLKTVNISNPNAMSVASTVTTNSAPIELAIQGSYLYVVSQGGASSKLEIFSLANPASPALVGSTTVTVNPIPISVNGSYAYIGSKGWGRLEVVNISNPFAPSLVSGSASNSAVDPKGLYATGSYLYAAVSYGSNNQFQIWDISNSTTWSNLNNINISGGAPIFVTGGSGGYIYLLTTNNNTTSPLRIYRVTGSGGNTVSGDVVSAGASGSVTKVHALGSVYSRTISNALAEGNAFFKNISNTTVMGISYPNSTDQPLTTMPVSDDDIAVWEAEAVAGGTISSPCPYTISADMTLGPKKINCDLVLSGSSNLTLAGPVWVSGNVTLSNNSQTIQVAPSISGKTVGIIADNLSNRTTSSKISIANSTTFAGSGTNSYIMLVSQNNSVESGGTQVAIDISNSASGKLLLYAPHGQINLSNNASIKEITAWKILLQNSAQVIYETGLANILFTSGPAGGYIFDGWGEAP